MLFTLQLDNMKIFTDYDRQLSNVCVLINLNQFMRGNLCSDLKYNKTIGDEGITVDFRFIKVHTSN